jgi:glycyl-tRNA synthetase beta subunit
MQFSTSPADFHHVNYGSSESALAKLTEQVRDFVDQRMQKALKTAAENHTPVTQIYASTSEMVCERRPNSEMLARAIDDVVNALIAAGFDAKTTCIGRDDDHDTIMITLPAIDPKGLPPVLTDRENELLNKLEEMVCRTASYSALNDVYKNAKELILKYRPDFKITGVHR